MVNQKGQKYVSTVVVHTVPILFYKLLFTTDVQNVRICQVEDSNSYLIQCGYVTGSDARGCSYCLLSDSQAKLNGTIDRSNSGGAGFDINSYSELLAYDWEIDNTTGTLSVREDISDSTFNECPTPIDNSVSAGNEFRGVVLE